MPEVVNRACSLAIGACGAVLLPRLPWQAHLCVQVYQRQLSKEGLQSVVNSAATGSGGASSNAMSTEELRDLFTLRRHTRSDTYDCMCDNEEEEAGGSETGDAVAAPAAGQPGQILKGQVWLC